MIWNKTDFWIVVGYLVLMLGVAFGFRRYAAASLDNFYLSGRKVPGWMNGISYTAALVSPDAATGYGGLAVVTGAFISWWYLSRFGLAFFIGGVLFAVFWKRLNLFTSLEFYDLRFPPLTASIMQLWIAIRTSLIAIPAWTGITLLAAYKILGPALGLSKIDTFLLVVPVSFIYVFFSGYKGVVISNFIQMIIFFIGILTLAYLTLEYFGGASAMVQALTQTFGTSNPEILYVIPPREHDVFSSTAALAWLFGQSIGYGGDTAPMGGAMEGQRIFSTRSPKEAITMYVVAAFSMFTILLLITLPSISAVLIWPELRDAGADRELVYGYLMKAFLPVGAMGLMVAAMMAAVMSTVADNLNFGSQIMVSDIYRRWMFTKGKEKHYLQVGKIGMILIIIMSMVVAFKVEIIVDVAIFMLQLSAAEMPANWAQWWWWRFNGPARIAASFGGAAIFCIVVLGPQVLQWFGIAWAENLLLPWWWQTFLVMGLTTILWVCVALLTTPDSYIILDKFHERVKPLGFWGPFKKNDSHTMKEIAYKPILRGIWVAFIGFASIALFILGLTQLWFAKFLSGTLLLVIAILLFVFFRISANSFLHFLDKRFEKNGD